MRAAAGALPLVGELPMMALPRSEQQRADHEYATQRAEPRDEGENPPHPDRVQQQRTWQARLVAMAKKGRGTAAQLLAGRLLAEHGLDARRVLLEQNPGWFDDRVMTRAEGLLADCGLAVYGVTTHQAEQGALL